jgi:hypothetical protein
LSAITILVNSIGTGTIYPDGYTSETAWTKYVYTGKVDKTEIARLGSFTGKIKINDKETET